MTVETNMNKLTTKAPDDLEVSGFKLTATGLVPTGDPTYDQWYACGEWLKRAEKAVGFWIGDWLIYGRGKYGERYSQAMTDTGLEYQTLANYKYVAENVEFSSRKENLSFKHHFAVAPLSSWEQKEILELAEQQKWDAEETRVQVKAYKLKQHNDSLPKFDGRIETLDRLTIINGDACELSNLVSKAQLIFTSPPYNVGIAYGEHDDSMDAAEYETMMRQIFYECYSTLVVGGRMGVVVPFGIDRNPYVPLVPMMLRLLDDAGFILRGIVTWDKATTGNRTTWGSWMSSSNPALRDRTESILIAHKVTPELEQAGASLLTDAEQFTQLAQDLWQIPPASAQRLHHPAPFPIELAERAYSHDDWKSAEVATDCFRDGKRTTMMLSRFLMERIAGRELSEQEIVRRKKQKVGTLWDFRDTNLELVN